MDLSFYFEEIERAYRCLSPEDADMQNLRDIGTWQSEGRISCSGAAKLLMHNKKLYNEAGGTYPAFKGC